jgi:serine/threonine protein kinase
MFYGFPTILRRRIPALKQRLPLDVVILSAHPRKVQALANMAGCRELFDSKMKIPVINKQEPLPVEAGVSKLSKVEFARNPYPALLKEPRNFWDEIFIANEAYMLDEITHPRIRSKLAYDAASHSLFLKYVEGTTLNELVQAGVTLKEPGRTHKILQSVAETVADMHAEILCDRPIIHNDLKSMNVLVPAAFPAEGMLIDFSHSYFAGYLPPFITDKKQNLVGTAKYMAPEKWDGDYANGFKGDVFAFGVMAYYACTGRHPFEGDAAQLEKQIRGVTPSSPIQLGVEVLRNTSVIIMSCLEKKPDQRPSMERIAQCYADAADLFRHLDRDPYSSKQARGRG